MLKSTTALPTVMKARSPTEDLEVPQSPPNDFKAKSHPLPDYLRSILSTAETSVYTNLSTSYLEKGRIKGYGPTFVYLTSKRVGYRRQDLDAWLAARVKLPEVSNVEAASSCP